MDYKQFVLKNLKEPLSAEEIVFLFKQENPKHRYVDVAKLRREIDLLRIDGSIGYREDWIKLYLNK